MHDTSKIFYNNEKKLFHHHLLIQGQQKGSSEKAESDFLTVALVVPGPPCPNHHQFDSMPIIQLTECNNIDRYLPSLETFEDYKPPGCCILSYA